MSPKRLEIADWIASEEDGTLTGPSGEPIRLEPKVMQVLLCLADRAGEVVPKEEIFATVWPDTVGEDGVLPQAIHTIRKALGDDARAPSFIETIPRRGYRLIAEVVDGDGREAEGAETERDPGPPLAGPSPRSPGRWALIGLATIGLLAAGWWAGTARKSELAIAQLPLTPDRPAILRLLVLGALAGEEPIIELQGLQTEIFRRLRDTPGLTVVRGPTRVEKKEPQDVGAGGKDPRDWLTAVRTLHETDFWLELTIAESNPDGEAHLVTRLLREGDETVAWSGSFALRTESREAIVRRVVVEARRALRLEAFDLDWIRKGGTKNSPAYGEYLQGLGVAAQQGNSASGLLDALGHFERATELDPSFLNAYAEQVEINHRLYRNYDRSQDRLAKAYAALRRAKALERNLQNREALPHGLPQVLLAEASYLYGLGDYSNAARMARQASELLPDDAEPLMRAAWADRRAGRLEEALHLLSKAQQLEPSSSLVASEIAEVLQALRFFDQADAAFQQAIDLELTWQAMGQADPANLRHLIGERAIAAVGRFGEARTPYQVLVRDLRRLRTGDDGRGHCAEGSAPQADSLSPYLFRLALLRSDFEDALDELETTPRECLGNLDRLQRDTRETLLLRELGDEDGAERALRDAEMTLDRARDRIPPDYLRGYQGLIHALRGDGERARIEAAGALEPFATDHYSGPMIREIVAMIHMLVGDADQAVKQLDWLLSHDYQHALSVDLIRLDPTWRPLRPREDFQGLLVETSTPIAESGR